DPVQHTLGRQRRVVYHAPGRAVPQLDQVVAADDPDRPDLIGGNGGHGVELGVRAGEVAVDDRPLAAVPMQGQGPVVLHAHGPHVVSCDDGYSIQAAGRAGGGAGDDAPGAAVPVFDQGVVVAVGLPADGPDIVGGAGSEAPDAAD